MRKQRIRSFDSLALVLLSIQMLAFGCASHSDGEHGNEEHEHDHGNEEAAGSDFKDGEGLLLSEEAEEQIGLRASEAARRDLSIEFTTVARIYQTSHAHSPGDQQRTHHESHATAIVPPHLAGFLRPGHSVEINNPDGLATRGRISRVDTETAAAIAQVEAIIDVPDPQHRYDFGEFVRVTFFGGDREVLAVPQEALLETATGTFVYSKNADRFLRRRVELGARSGGFVEIISGILKGEMIVTHGAVDLWLVELRFTKGGGHSH